LKIPPPPPPPPITFAPPFSGPIGPRNYLHLNQNSLPLLSVGSAASPKERENHRYSLLQIKSNKKNTPERNRLSTHEILRLVAASSNRKHSSTREANREGGGGGGEKGRCFRAYRRGLELEAAAQRGRSGGHKRRRRRRRQRRGETEAAGSIRSGTPLKAGHLCCWEGESIQEWY
jgi:hypothetical protein